MNFWDFGFWFNCRFKCFKVLSTLASITQFKSLPIMTSPDLNASSLVKTSSKNTSWLMLGAYKATKVIGFASKVSLTNKYCPSYLEIIEVSLNVTPVFTRIAMPLDLLEPRDWNWVGKRFALKMGKLLDIKCISCKNKKSGDSLKNWAYILQRFTKLLSPQPFCEAILRWLVIVHKVKDCKLQSTII